MRCEKRCAHTAAAVRIWGKPSAVLCGTPPRLRQKGRTAAPGLQRAGAAPKWALDARACDNEQHMQPLGLPALRSTHHYGIRGGQDLVKVVDAFLVLHFADDLHVLPLLPQDLRRQVRARPCSYSRAPASVEEECRATPQLSCCPGKAQ